MLIAITLLVPALQSARRVSHPAPSPGGLPTPARPPGARTRAAGPSTGFWRIKDSTQLTAELGFPSNPPRACHSHPSVSLHQPGRREAPGGDPQLAAPPNPPGWLSRRDGRSPAEGPAFCPIGPAEGAPAPPRQPRTRRGGASAAAPGRAARPREPPGGSRVGGGSRVLGGVSPVGHGAYSEKKPDCPRVYQFNPPPLFFF